MPDKHVHHFAPKKYLRGFTLLGEKSLIWEYARNGPSFSPGMKRGKNNPARVSVVKQAGAERDGYACPKPDGTIDYNTYEDRLARIEHKYDRTFDKLRNREMITAQEKEDFATYLAMMIRRVPAGRASTRELWPGVVQDFQTNKLPELLSRVDKLIDMADPADIKRLEHLHKQREIAVPILEEYRQNGMPRAIELETLVGSEMTRVRAAITTMRWQFFEVPGGKFLLTSDNPVHLFRGGVGLRMPYSELVFPISSALALVASHHDVREGFVAANGQAVNEINRRVVSQSMEYAYGSSAASWALMLLTKTRHRFELLYPYQSEWGELPRAV
ncbi:MAG: DUF4238 domain-containing protein [Acidobacteriota bacterium]